MHGVRHFALARQLANIADVDNNGLTGLSHGQRFFGLQGNDFGSGLGDQLFGGFLHEFSRVLQIESAS